MNPEFLLILAWLSVARCSSPTCRADVSEGENMSKCAPRQVALMQTNRVRTREVANATWQSSNQNDMPQQISTPQNLAHGVIEPKLNDVSWSEVQNAAFASIATLLDRFAYRKNGPEQQADLDQDHPWKQGLQNDTSVHLEISAWTVSFAAILYVGWSTRQQVKLMADAPSRIVTFIVLSIFVRCMDFSIVLPTVYDLVQQAGGSAAFSGSVIGASYTTAFIGVFMLNSAPFSKIYFRHLTLGCLAVLPLSSALYVVSSMSHEHLRLCLMFTARALSGVAEGILSTMHPAMLARVSHSEQLIDICALYTVSESLGYAVGPMVSSVWLQRIVPVMPTTFVDPLLVPVAGMAHLHLVVLAVAVFLIPGTQEVEDAKLAEEEEDEECKARQNHITSALFLLVAILTYFMSTALESATALVLEVQFSWSNTRIGYAIGLAFSTSILIHLFIKRSLRYFSDACLTLVALCVATLAVWFWLPTACPQCTDEHRCWLILGADAIIYGMLTLSIGNSEGLAMDLNKDEVNTICGFLTCSGSFASAISPAFSRYLVKTGGIEQYAVMQITICVGTLLFGTGAAVRYCHKLPLQLEDSEKDLSSKG